MSDDREIVSVFARFNHMNKVLSDPGLAQSEDPYHKTAYELWRAIKIYMRRKLE